ncbi:MAG: nitroreductase family protein [Candidatus Methanomethylophilaceae archaeon]|nr:nitroreductase family protein [Candidatus Methanomethylophilaceae archaeon]
MGLFSDLARDRATVREFSPEPLSDAEIAGITGVGDLAPTSRNLRPVRLHPVTDTAVIRELAGCKSSGTRALETATFAVVVAADPAVSDVWIEDCSIATVMMQFAAQDLGIGSCWIQVRLRDADGVPASETVKTICGLDHGLEVLSIVAFGRPRTGGV